MHLVIVANPLPTVRTFPRLLPYILLALTKHYIRFIVVCILLVGAALVVWQTITKNNDIVQPIKSATGGVVALNTNDGPILSSTVVGTATLKWILIGLGVFITVVVVVLFFLSRTRSSIHFSSLSSSIPFSPTPLPLLPSLILPSLPSLNPSQVEMKKSRDELRTLKETLKAEKLSLDAKEETLERVATQLRSERKGPEDSRYTAAYESYDLAKKEYNDHKDTFIQQKNKFEKLRQPGPALTKNISGVNPEWGVIKVIQNTAHHFCGPAAIAQIENALRQHDAGVEEKNIPYLQRTDLDDKRQSTANEMYNAATKWLKSNNKKFDDIMTKYGMTLDGTHLVDAHNSISFVSADDMKFIRLYTSVLQNHRTWEHTDGGITPEFAVPWLEEKFDDVVLDFVAMTQENGKPFIRRIMSFNPHKLKESAKKHIRYVTILDIAEKANEIGHISRHVEYIFNREDRFGRLKEGTNDSYEHIYPDDLSFFKTYT